MADAFVDSVGICAHFDSEPYRAQSAWLPARLGALGIRHVRDEVRADNNVAFWRAIHHEAKVRFHLLVSPATNMVRDMLDYLDALGPDAVTAIEGQNEGDSPWFQRQAAARGGWAAAVNAYQHEVYRAVRTRFDPASLPVLSPTVLDYRPEDMALLQPSAPACDAVAIHAYPQAQQEPETNDAYAALSWYLRRFRDEFKPGAPVMLTEAGYYGGVNGLSARAAAIYLPRLLLTAFAAGVARTFLYELLDEGVDPADPEQNYGLLTASGGEKPAYAALRLLLAALADPGPAFVPMPLPLGIEGNSDRLRCQLFQKRDGTTLLALWRAERVWDPAQRRELALSSEQVRLTVSSDIISVRTLVLERDAGWRDAGWRDAGWAEASGRPVELDVTPIVQLVILRR